jgi:Protein of unknown function (DUF1475)
MRARTALLLLFGLILLTILSVNIWASVEQPVWEWGGLVTRPDRAWTIATMTDAYCGFLTFYAWVFYKERALGRVVWFVLIMLLGNIAMAIYMLRALWVLPPDAPVSRLLERRAP